ncbi:MAG: hypothetical protein AMXMBFR7_49180 [Planctomycetota bacterium]
MRQGIEEKNRVLLERLHRGAAGPFSVTQAAELLSIPVNKARFLLAYLYKRGWLSRVKQGTYTTVPLGATEPSAWREDPWIVAATLFDPCYIGGWSACEHWALTEQLFRDVVVVTARPVRNHEQALQGTTYRLKHLPDKLHFGTKVVWRNQTRVQVSDPHRTIVDVLDDPSIGGGIRQIAESLGEYLGGEHRDDAVLIGYAKRLGNRTVFKRLGFLVETLQFDAPDLIMACRENLSAGLSPLDPAVKSPGKIRKRWNLRVNVSVGERAS